VSHIERSREIVLGVVLCLVLLVPSAASAHFVRPFVRQLAGTCEKAEESPPSCAGSKFVPFGGPGEIAVDGEDDLWVLEERSNVRRTNVDEFGPSGVYKQTLEPPSLNFAEYLAIGSTGALYVSSNHAEGNFGHPQVEIFSKAGVLEKTFAPSGKSTSLREQALAVDDSTDPLDPSMGDIYVEGGYDGESQSLQKFNAAGEPVDWESFKGSESCKCSVSGNEIIFAASAPTAVAVDPANGDIWVAGDVQGSQGVFEFSPGGELIREVTSEDTPGFGEEANSFQYMRNLAIDPTNHDLLVSLTNTNDEGAVDEFNSEGVFLGQITEAAGEPLRGAFGLAADSHGDLYVVNDTFNGAGNTHAVDEFEAGHFVPGVRPAAATQDKPASVVLNGVVDPESNLNPEKEGITDCHFEYVSEVAFEKSGFEDLSSGGDVPCEHPDAGEIPRSDAETPVHALVSEHVESGVTYRYRLSATVGGKLGGSLDSATAVFTAAHAPRIGATAASDVTSTFAQLSADIDPLGSDTTYQFQYLPEEQFKRAGESFAGAAVAPAAPADIGSGGEAGDLSEAVGEQVGGLAPATTYRFRVVASNEAGVSEGEAAGGGGEVAHTFVTLPAVSPVLPDGRAYELVTPPDKEGTEDLFAGVSFNEGASSESGDQFVLETRAAFGPFPAPGVNVYVFSRHPVEGHPEHEEWSYASLASPALGQQNLNEGIGAIEPAAFSKVAVNDTVGALASEAGIASTSLVGLPGGPYTTLHTDQFTHEADHGGLARGFPWERTEVIGASRDLGVVVLRSDNPALAEGGLCKADVCSEPLIPDLYVWAGGELGRLAVQSDGEPIGSCGAALGSGKIAEDENADNGAVSADGSKIFFTAPIPSAEAAYRSLEGVKGCATKTGENPAELYMRSGEETIEVSAPEEGAPEHRATHEAVFFGASEDGSRVFFTSEGELTANDKGIHDMELYEYDTETGKLTRVSAGDSGDAAGDVVPFGKHLAGILQQSLKDVVVSSDGSHVYFVARGVLAPANAEGEAPTEGEENLYVYDTQTGNTVFIAGGAGGPNVSEYAAPETTPDGRFLLFQGEMLSEGYLQLYRYDADTEVLACVSCGPGDPSGVGVLAPIDMEDTAGWRFPAHAIAEDGSVFFNTEASLVAQDTNGLLDVYEWHEGEISLISSGQDAQPSYFLGASPSGADVFFGTHSRLVPAATGSGGNLYDARVCTAAEPCIAAALAREGLCEGDACSHPAAAPSDATPASATFAGAGDLVSVPSAAPRAKRCVKPKKLSHGRCVSVKPKRRRTKAKPGSRKATAERATRSEKRGKRS
jgi:hypothetical protein